jgi:TetR/AcrR family transcriptional regulator, fatty acid metabolism regulator protein
MDNHVQLIFFVGKIMAKKEMIVEVAMSIFLKRGFTNTKISDIAKKAGIATGSVYLYFDNKNSILEEIYINFWETLTNMLIEIQKKEIPIPEIFEIYFQYLLDMVYSNKDLIRMLVNEQQFLNAERMFHLKERVNKINILIAEIIQKGQKQGIFNKDLDTYSTAAIIMGGTWYFFVSKIDSLKDPDAKPNMKKQLLDTFLLGLIKKD